MTIGETKINEITEKEVKDSIERFLTNGGKIQTIPIGVCADPEFVKPKIIHADRPPEKPKAGDAMRSKSYPSRIAENISIANGSKTFHGIACSKGHTLRKVGSRKCVECNPPKYTESTARKDAQLAGATTYHGKPCKEGHTLRRTGDKNCIACDNVRVSKNRIARRKGGKD